MNTALAGHRRLLIVLAAMTMFTPMATDMYLPTFPSLAKDLGVHIVNLQLTLTSFMIGIAIGQIFWGPISDRFGRKGPSYIGISGSFVTFAYVSSAPAVLMGEYGVSRSTFGILFGLISIGLLASSRINIWLVGRMGLVKMMRGFTAVQTLATLVILVIAITHGPLWLLLIFVVILNMAFAMLAGALIAFTQVRLLSTAG